MCVWEEVCIYHRYVCKHFVPVSAILFNTHTDDSLELCDSLNQQFVTFAAVIGEII